MKSNTVHRVLTFVILTLQMVLAFTLTYIIYMVLAVTQDFEGGLDNIVGIAVIQPVLGAVICGLTIFACLLVGLPLRLVKKINNWWINQYVLGLAGIFIGIMLLIMSMTPAFRETVKVTTVEKDQIKAIPNITFALTGWFVTAFFSLHIYPPKLIRNLLVRFISKMFPQNITV